MADGSRSFNFPAPQRSRLRPGEISVDLFAGGGGASQAIKDALGVDPALAYNHDEQAIGMHAANHPFTIHHREDIWHADPCVDVAGRPVGWLHFSSDCTHFSQAKGGQPRSRKIRALSWVGLKWIGQLLAADKRNGTNTAPRIVSMENVWQILTWGPLVAKRCKGPGASSRWTGLSQRAASVYRLATSSWSPTNVTWAVLGGSSSPPFEARAIPSTGADWTRATLAPAPTACVFSWWVAATVRQCVGPSRRTQAPLPAKE